MKTPLVFTAIAATALVAGLCGCTSDDDGASTSTTSGSTKKTVTEFDWDLDYAECMRGKGNDYPDPGQGDKSRQLTIGEGKTEETFDADLASCTKTVTAELGKRPVSEKNEAAEAEAKENSDCLRKNGVDVPDQSGDAAPALNTAEIPKDVLEKCGYGELADR